MVHTYSDIISLENLALAWQEFTHGKKSKHDVQIFSRELMDFLKTIASGVDFLGWVNFPNHRILCRTTKRRMLSRIKQNPKPESLQSYLGLLKHGNTHKIKEEFLGEYWLWK